MSIRVAIVDDHARVRRGLRAILEHYVDMEVVGEAMNGAEAAERCLAWKPNVVTMDVQMPVVDGIEATRRIKALLPKAHVLAVSASSNGRWPGDMLAAGASGYVLKDCLFEELAIAVRDVARGGVFLSDQVIDELIASLDTVGLSLTPEEVVVLQNLVRGRNRIEMARELNATTDAITQTWQAVMTKAAGSPLETWLRQAWSHALCIRWSVHSQNSFKEDTDGKDTK